LSFTMNFFAHTRCIGRHQDINDCIGNNT
jgi:hypothetical protein